MDAAPRADEPAAGVTSHHPLTPGTIRHDVSHSTYQRGLNHYWRGEGTKTLCRKTEGRHADYVLSERNRELLAMIAREKPDSLTELAEFAGRSTSNLSRTLKTMARYGLVELEAGRRGRLVPRVPYDRVTLDVSLTPPPRQVV